MMKPSALNLRMWGWALAEITTHTKHERAIKLHQ